MISRAIDGEVNLFGDVRDSAESTVIAKAAGDNEMTRKVIRMKVDRLITERTGPGPTPTDMKPGRCRRRGHRPGSCVSDADR